MNFNFNEIIKNIGGMKEQFGNVQARLKNMRISGEAGAGLLRVTVSGDGELQGIEIDPVLLKPEEKEMLEELIISAFHEAQEKARETQQGEVKKLIGDIPIPGLDRLL